MHLAVIQTKESGFRGLVSGLQQLIHFMNEHSLSPFFSNENSAALAFKSHSTRNVKTV
jgi:hypothetical protein